MTDLPFRHRLDGRTATGFRDQSHRVGAGPHLLDLAYPAWPPLHRSQTRQELLCFGGLGGLPVRLCLDKGFQRREVAHINESLARAFPEERGHKEVRVLGVSRLIRIDSESIFGNRWSEIEKTECSGWYPKNIQPRHKHLSQRSSSMAGFNIFGEVL